MSSMILILWAVSHITITDGRIKEKAEFLCGTTRQ